MIEFRILGPLEVLDGERRVPLGGAKRRAVLALLLLDANQVVSTERLIDGVWGDEPPAGALASLQNHVLRLRRELGERIVTRAPGYLVRVERDELDLERFRRLVEEARTREPGEAAALLRDALALWRGPPLADLADEPVIAAAAGLEGLRLDTLERRLDAELALGRHAELVAELEALVVEQPFRERLRAQLVLALYRSGRQGEALEAYANARAAFVDELGLEPGAELQELQRAVLRQDPALDAPASAPVAGTPAIEESRKTVTVLLGDLGTDTQDPESRREELRRARADATATVEAYGGSVDESVNDRVVAIFGVPAAREDDALRGVRAACDLRAAGVVTRAAVATGNVITGDPSRGRPLVSGPPLQEADRLLAGAADGDVLAGERTLRLVQHAVVPGAAPRSVERVLPDAEAVARRLETPLVGRADELGELFAAFQLATTTGQARLVTVLGPPGVGKTRLAREVVDVLAGTATCAVGKTPSDGNAATYAPLRDAFSTLAAGRIGAWAAGVLAGQTDAEAVAERVAAASGETESLWPTEETAWAVRRLLETLAREKPVVLVLEDLHDASPAMLDLVEHVATLARAPILLVVLARPELLDARPDWGGGMRGASILLDALPPERAASLLDNLVARPVAPERRAAILRAAAGNPLFLEQLLVASEDDDLSVPDSIHALLAARLDRLGEEERRVLQTASVFGETFPTALVQSLVATDARQALLALARRDFVEPAAPDPFGSESWAFRHALVRDETYATLPKLRRAQLHELVAAVIESITSETGVDASEAIGNHFELAYRALLEVDPQAPELGRLARGAAQHLAAAGRRAVDEREMGTAAALLQRAFGVAPPDAPERLDIAIRLADALSWNGWTEEGLRVLDEADRLAETADARERARAVVVRRALRLWGAEPENAAEALADARGAIASLEEVGDHESLAYAYVLAYQAAVRLSSAEYQERDLTRAIAHARAAGVRALEGLATGWLCVELRHGPLPVDQAKRRILEVLDDPATQLARAGALGGLADLRGMEGAFDEARALVAENHAIIEDLGMPQTEAADLIAVADVELQAGDLDAAERVLREAVDRLASLEAHYEQAHAAWRLARVLVRQGRDAEARPFVSLASVVRGGEFVGLWTTVLEATIAARQGGSDAEALLERADQGLERFTETGMLVDVILQTAEVSALLGRPDDAAARLRRAAALAERLGYVVALREATARLAEIEARL